MIFKRNVCSEVSLITSGGKPLYELNRILRPGGYFAWSATPVYRNDERDQKVWNGLSLILYLHKNK
jgi:hypothetical protein